MMKIWFDRGSLMGIYDYDEPQKNGHVNGKMWANGGLIHINSQLHVKFDEKMIAHTWIAMD
jgi:hypothetical protein